MALSPINRVSREMFTARWDRHGLDTVTLGVI